MVQNLLSNSIANAGIEFVAGVPDSVLAKGIAELEEGFRGAHLVAANEGAAVGLALGHYLASSKIPLVYMQNSGLGNALNPLISLAHEAVYAIPMVLLIGWRAEVSSLTEGQVDDEPQHMPQGAATLGILEQLGIPYLVVDEYEQFPRTISKATNLAQKDERPVAVVVRRKVFSSRPNFVRAGAIDSLGFTRESMISAIAQVSVENPRDLIPIVATTGMASRELHELRVRSNIKNSANLDFLVVGGMGHAVSVASGLAHGIQGRTVICVDGDGAFLMHTGAALNAAKMKSLIHVVLDNGVHDSVGGQPTGIRGIDPIAIAKGFGYGYVEEVSTPGELTNALSRVKGQDLSVFILAKCAPGHREDIGRPKTSPKVAKECFMSEVKRFEARE